MPHSPTPTVFLSITLGKQQFGNADPDLIIKVFDGQERVLYLSSEFSPPQSEDSHSLGSVVVTDMPVPYTWLIRGLAFNQNSTPFSQGLIGKTSRSSGSPRLPKAGQPKNGARQCAR